MSQTPTLPEFDRPGFGGEDITLETLLAGLEPSLLELPAPEVSDLTWHSMSEASSPTSEGGEDLFGFTEQELLASKQDFARMVAQSGLDEQQLKELRKVRRRLKSRGYAKASRRKRQVRNGDVEARCAQLEQENLALRQTNEHLLSQLALLLRHR